MNPPTSFADGLRWSLGAIGVLLVALTASAVFPDSPWLLIAPWLASLVFLGLPHGAVDHWVVLDLLRPRRDSSRLMFVVMTLYLMAAGLILVIWKLAPELSFFGFIALTWFHWGTADAWWSWHRQPELRPSPASWLVFALHRGSLPMLVPLLLYPTVFAKTANGACSIWGSSFDFAWLASTPVLLSAACVVLGLATLDFIMAARRGSWAADGLESLALAVFFLGLNPLLSIGAYFCAWHGLRHIIRLHQTHPGVAGTATLFLKKSFPSLVCSLVALGLLTLGLQVHANLWSYLGGYLVLISALTVPHAVVVYRQDRAEGLSFFE